MWSSGTMLPAKLLYTSEVFWRPAAGGWRTAAMQQRRSTTGLSGERKKIRGGPESPCVREMLGCTWCCWEWPLIAQPSDKANPHGLPRLSKLISVSLSFASTFSATIFHCSVSTSQNRLLQRVQRLAAMGSRSKCLSHLTCKSVWSDS